MKPGDKVKYLEKEFEVDRIEGPFVVIKRGIEINYVHESSLKLIKQKL